MGEIFICNGGGDFFGAFSISNLFSAACKWTRNFYFSIVALLFKIDWFIYNVYTGNRKYTNIYNGNVDVHFVFNWWKIQTMKAFLN